MNRTICLFFTLTLLQHVHTVCMEGSQEQSPEPQVLLGQLSNCTYMAVPNCFTGETTILELAERTEGGFTIVGSRTFVSNSPREMRLKELYEMLAKLGVVSSENV